MCRHVRLQAYSRISLPSSLSHTSFTSLHLILPFSYNPLLPLAQVMDVDKSTGLMRVSRKALLDPAEVDTLTRQPYVAPPKEVSVQQHYALI